MAVNWFDYQPRVDPLYGGPQFEAGNPVSAARQSETVQYAPRKQGQGTDPLTTAIGLGAITKAAQDDAAKEAATGLWDEALQDGLGDQIAQASGWFGSAAPEVAAETAAEEAAAGAAGEGLAEAGLSSVLGSAALPLGAGLLGGLLFSRWL